MQIVKKLLRGLTAYIFKFLILLLAVVASLVFTFNSPKKIEKSLKDSGVYSTFVDSVLKEAQKSASNNKTANIPISDPAIKDAANKAFTPELLQTSTESVLNGTYDWLQGKVQIPDFKIDLSQAKRNFAVGVGVAAEQRLNSLPACTVQQLKQIGTDIDPFSIDCLPPNLDVAAQTKKVSHDLSSSKDFIGTPIVTAKNLPKNSRGQTIFDQLSKAPKIYKLVNASPWLIAGLAVITGGLCVLLYDSRRRGLRNLSINLIDTGVVLVIISVISKWIIGKVDQPGGKLGDAVKGSFQQTVIKAIGSITGSIERTIIWFGAAYIIIGALVLLVLRFTKPKLKGGKVDNPEIKQAEPKTPAPPTVQHRPPQHLIQ